MANERPGPYYTERQAVGPIAGTAGTRSALSAGAVAGLIAGIGMGLAAMLREWAVSGDANAFWMPMKLIAATFYGVDALIGGTAVILVGMVTHLAVAAFWGFLFGLFIGGRNSVGGAILYGLIYGVVVWAVMSWIAQPIFNPDMQVRTVGAIPGWWFIYHLVYGGLLCFTPLLARTFAEPQGRRTP